MFIPDLGSDFFPSRIPDPNCLHPGSGSRILIKEFIILTPKKQKKRFLSSKKYDPGCSSRIPDPDADFLPSRIPVPGSRGQKSTQSRIPDPDPQHATLLELFVVANLFVMFCRTRHNGREPSQVLLDAINQDPDLR
jgi:hypothetical protein